MLSKITQLKLHFCKHFQTKDLRSLKYFLGMEVPQSNESVLIFQRKYVLDMSIET